MLLSRLVGWTSETKLAFECSRGGYGASEDAGCVGEYGSDDRSIDMPGTSLYPSSCGIQSVDSALASFALICLRSSPVRDEDE